MTTATHEVTTTTKPQTPIERRAASNPILIGIITGAVWPWLAGVFAFRQRSWTLVLVASLPVLMWAWTEPDIEGGLRNQGSTPSTLHQAY